MQDAQKCTVLFWSVGTTDTVPLSPLLIHVVIEWPLTYLVELVHDEIQKRG